MEHELKIIDPWYLRVRDEEKSAELREDDRDFQVGDTIVFVPWDEKGKVEIADPEHFRFKRTITHILRDVDGLDSDYVILSIK